MPNIDQVQLPDGSQYNLKDNISGYVTAGYVNDAIDALTKADVGLGNVDNTSDLNKPVSTAQQTALNGKTDTTVIAPTEATTTASKRYEIGEQFILNGVLYTATAVIASGDTIIENTNCDLSENITEQIDEKAEKTDLTSISESGTTASQAISAGTYFYLDGTLVRAKTNIASGATFTLNTNYELVMAGALNKSPEWVNITSQCTFNSAYNHNLSVSDNGQEYLITGAAKALPSNGATIITFPKNLDLGSGGGYVTCIGDNGNGIPNSGMLARFSFGHNANTLGAQSTSGNGYYGVYIRIKHF